MALTKIGASLSGGADTVFVTQAGHGLVVGRAVKSTGNGTYGYAKADSVVNAEVVGIIIETTTDTMRIALSGRITVDAAVLSGTPGTVLFLSPSSNAGELQTAAVVGSTEISKPVAIITYSGSEMVMIQQRGAVISTAGTTNATEATEANMKAEATGILYAPPDLLKHSPGVAKAWAKVAATGSFSGYDQYNMDFDSDHGAGMHTLGFTTEMENNGYVVVGNCTNTDGLYILTTYAAGGASFRVNIQNTGGTETDQQYGVAIFGQVT